MMHKVSGTEEEKLQKMIEVMQKMVDASTSEEIWNLLFKGVSLIIDAPHVVISQLDDSTGKLQVIQSEMERQKLPEMSIGKGITGKALQDDKIICVDDVQAKEWQDIYVQFWPDTRSEMALPIIVNRIPVRVGREVQMGTKALGVLNLESPEIAAFSKFSKKDEERLQLLVQHAATLLDRWDSDQKLKRLRQIEKEIAKQITKQRDTDTIIKNILKGIRDILGFEFINISLVNADKNEIHTEYIDGLLSDDEHKFKQMASHPLDGRDIQADIVRNRQIEVPELEDVRFDQTIFERFQHEQMIRVFLPMIGVSSSRVLGTLEAGYQRSYRKHIYERDVQILESLADHVVHARERNQSGMVDRIMHELKSPIVGIRSNADFLQRRFKQLPQARIDIKLEDILTDCEMLLSQVGSLEYIFSGRKQPEKLNISRVNVLSEVVLKTFYQLKPIILEMGFSLNSFQYNSGNTRRVIVDTDAVRLNQVVYNLLINSIKYAEPEPDKFQIFIDINDNRDCFIIQFKDWGIGINEQYKNEIFKQGIRTPEAINKNVSGSGLGLAISRTIMRELGGDLTLVRCSKPTEFHMIIPKNFQQEQAS
jgi:signal transduction histidine kinase/putative methionine-R-sulfoxide reductase with GAF domain